MDLLISCMVWILVTSGTITGVLTVLGIVFDFCDKFVKFVGWTLILSFLIFSASIPTVLMLLFAKSVGGVIG